MTDANAAFARTLWRHLEPLRAVAYFAPESRDAVGVGSGVVPFPHPGSRPAVRPPERTL
ncbi:hypothetical protein [Streptomyces sp. NPDC054829]